MSLEAVKTGLLILNVLFGFFALAMQFCPPFARRVGRLLDRFGDWLYRTPGRRD